MAGGRPQQNETERLSAVVSFRVTEAERARIEARAAAADARPSDYARAVVLDAPTPPRRRASPATAARLSAAELRELNRIGVNLNQLARALNMGTADPVSADIADALTQLRAILGRFL